MVDKNPNRHTNPDYADDTRSDELRDSAMMRHLMDALKAGEDIGHYGRLVFAMVGQYFLEDGELARLLGNNLSEEEAQALVAQVKSKGYNPPKRERILEWQAEQDFPICPDPDDPQACNVYRELRFPDEVYANIGEFWVEKSGQE